MKIEHVETFLFRSCRNYLLVKIITDDGVVGWGDATLNGREMVVKSLIDNYLEDMLIGCDASRIQEIWQMIYIGSYWRGGPVIMTALAGIDMALWDIKGKYARMPLSDLIGGRVRNKIEVYSHVHGSDVDDLIESVYRKQSEGFQTLRYSFDSKDHRSDMIFRQPHQDIVKGHIEKELGDSLVDVWDSRTYARDLLNVTSRLRTEFGMDLGLVHDVHSRLTISAAKEVCRELESMHLMFIEDPIDSKKTNGLAEIRKNSVIPIGIGELFNSVDECRELIARRQIDYLRIDISHFGGITPAIRAAALAEVFDVKIAFHGPSDISPVAHAACYHIDSSIPNFGIQEYVEFEPEIKRVFKLPFTYDNGFVTICDEPGLGVTLDEEYLKSCEPYRKSYLPMLRDRAHAIHNW